MATTVITDKQLLTSSLVSDWVPLNSYWTLDSCLTCEGRFCLTSRFGPCEWSSYSHQADRLCRTGRSCTQRQGFSLQTFLLSALFMFGVTGGVWASSLSLLCPRGCLHPVLQPGQPCLLPEHRIQVDPADPLRKPDLSNRPGWNPV